MMYFQDYFANKQDRQKEGAGGQNTWGGPHWLAGPEIVVKRLVMGGTVKRVGGP